MPRPLPVCEISTVLMALVGCARLLHLVAWAPACACWPPSANEFLTALAQGTSTVGIPWLKHSTMWHNVVWIGGAGLASVLGVWLLCRACGYTVAAWVAPLTISAFCLGLFLGVENTAKGRFKLPSLLGHHSHRPHLIHHTAR